MTISTSTRGRSSSRVLLVGAIIVAAIIFAWRPVANRFGLLGNDATTREGKSSDAPKDASHSEEHGHDAHDHAAHEDENSLELSMAAKKNLGLTVDYLRPIELSKYRRTISIPGIVVGRPGRSQIQVSTPLTGVVTHVHAVSGEAVTTGTLLFEIQLTHEELVTAQTDFLKTLGELDVEKQEITRLEGVAESGAISGRNLIERKYSRDKLTAALKALREALKLHGLSDRHVDEIEKDRKLLRSLQIVAPDVDRHDHAEELHLSKVSATSVSLSSDEDHDHSTDKTVPGNAVPGNAKQEGTHSPNSVSSQRPFVIGELAVIKGQSVQAGDKLCVVSDYESLFIEGQAFDQDASAINALAENGWTMTALVPREDKVEAIDGLKLAYVGSEVDVHARTLSLFVEIPNRLIRDITNESGQRFVTWKYRPGQRLQLQVPVEEWIDQIVLPVDAVAIEGPEAFVFQQNGSHFDRVGVHVIHRDQTHVVIANDGTLFPGDVVAHRSAHQMQMAIKNKSGTGADPHAGHNH